VSRTLERGALLRSIRREAAGAEIHAVVGGNGPPVVLVHGLGVSGAYMLPLARLLAPFCSVFVPDLPGHGRSGQPYGEWGLRELAETLGAWLDAMGVHETLAVANSMGCQVITELAVRRPALVGPMVLIGPTVDPAHRAARRQLFGLLRGSAREPVSLLALASREAAFNIRPVLRTARAAIADRIEERLPLIDRPTVIVYGEADGFVGRDWVERAAALLPDGRLVVVPSEAHAVHYTRPDLVAGIVQQLLAH
jgi:pimeloyl-ACP methyl ester carboxylesterase